MAVPGQIGPNDVNVLTSVMDFIATQGSYRYLEIGSYLGASLQWHLTNPACVQVVSIDKRSRDKIKDERQIDYAYTTTTQDMINALTSNGLPIDKLITINGTVDKIPLDDQFDLVFVDAEHTNQAVFYDAVKCSESMNTNSIIMFHDDWIVYKGIEKFEEYLTNNQQIFRKFKMQDSDITVIVLGELINDFDTQLGHKSSPWSQLVDLAESRLPKPPQQN